MRAVKMTASDAYVFNPAQFRGNNTVRFPSVT